MRFLSKITGKVTSDQPINISKIEGLIDPSTSKVLLSKLPEIPASMVAAEPVGSTITGIATHENTTNHPLATQTGKGMMAGTDKAKLDNIAAQATKNETDSALRDRSTHTGTQAIATITGLQTALDGKQNIFPLLNPGVLFAGPVSGNNALPAFRSLVPSDIPQLTSAKITGIVDLTTEQTIPVGKIFTGILRAQGAVNELALGVTRLDFGVQNNTPRIVFEQVGFPNWQVDSESGSFRWFTPGTTHMSIDNTTGNLTVRGALLPGTPLALARGGTGAVDAATARGNLGIAAATWSTLTLQNTWTSVTGKPVQYAKLSNGDVKIIGEISKALKPTAGEVIATLPVTFRPQQNLRFYLGDSSANSQPYIEINSSTGQLIYGNIGTIPVITNNFSLCSISFWAS